jgi:site-specific recombinase XerD
MIVIQAAYARWLNWLFENCPRSLDLLPVARMQPETIEDYIADQRKRIADISIGMAIHDIDAALKLLDRKYKAPWVKPILAILRRERPHRRNKTERIVPTKDLLEYGIQLMEQAGSISPMKRRAAVDYRDGLIIALLSVRPLRLANFIGLAVGKDIALRHNRFWCSIPATETKNRLNLEYPLPQQLQKQLEFYFEEVRPWFVEQAKKHEQPLSNCFWLSLWGRPISRNAFRAMLRFRTVAKFGKSVNPHLFRDCLATSIATTNPDLIWTTSLMLGHRSDLTSQISYTHNDPDHGQSIFLKHLETLRHDKDALSSKCRFPRRK